MNPMLAEAADPRQVASGIFLTSDRWLIQPKVDGERKLVTVDGDGGVQVAARDGAVSFLPPPIRDTLARLNMPVMLDGELLGDVLFVWDAPRYGNQVTEMTPCVERCAVAFGLAQAIGSDRIRAVPTAVDEAAKQAMIARVLDEQGEGVMAKLAASPYVGRRSRTWRKVKTMHEIDCVVDWLGDEKANMGLVVFDQAGNRVPVGEVGRGSGDGERVAEGDVVTVRVVYVSDDNRLVQPTLPRRRSDKRPSECSVDQLAAAYTNKALLTSWSAA